MLILSRKGPESILIRPHEDVDPAMTFADLFRNGPIEVKVCSAERQSAESGMQAAEQLSIWRLNSPPR